MKSNYAGFLRRSVLAITIVVASSVSVHAADASAKNTDSQKAARLFRDIQTDAAQVRSASVRLAELVRSSNATWLEYDRQWNEIKPSVERMQINLARLDAMQTAISPDQRKDLDQSKVLIGQIQSGTRRLRMLLDRQGAQLTNVKFKVCARSLENESTKLEQAVRTS